jgi:UDP-GlcNAc:undecaprenyl-phosphate GlcNAc-1-phosphate transferase
MDMLAIVVRRYKNGKSPFKPDRDHLHHILQLAGLNSSQALIVISSVAAVMSSIGVAGEYFNVYEAIMLVAFLVMFIIYNIVIQKVTK